MISENITPIITVMGVLTAGIVIGFFAPRLLLRLIFGPTTIDAVYATIVRHWALLVGSIGVLLIYAAFDPASRPPVLALAVVEKLSIAGLVLGTSLRRHRVASLIAGADLAMGLVCLLCLTAIA